MRGLLTDKDRTGGIHPVLYVQTEKYRRKLWKRRIFKAFLRGTLQYLYDGENHCLELTLDPRETLTVEENTPAFIQFSTGEEIEMSLSKIIVKENTKKIGCRYVVSEENKELFSQKTISAIYFSSKDYPQIEIAELNKYTAKKLMERFNCGMSTLGK